VKNTRLERYLNSATQGIVGKKRAQIQEELRGNLEQRAKELMAFGTAEKSALEQALNEFGAPKLVSRGMTQIYTLPWVNRTLGFGGILAATFATALLTSAKNIGVELVTPKYKCPQTKTEMCDMDGVYVNMDSLISSLEIKNAKLAIGNDNSMQFSVPHQQNSRNTYTISMKSDKKFSITTSAFSKNGNNYLDLDTVLQAFSGAGWNVTFDRIINPSLKIGDQSISLVGSKDVDISRSISHSIGKRFTAINGKIIGSGCLCHTAIKDYSSDLPFVGLPNKMYALISFSFDVTGWGLSAKKRPNRVTVEVAQADANGLFTMPSKTRDLKFLSSLATFKEGRAWNTAIILPLTGRLDKDQFDEKHPLVPENVELPAARLKEVQ
jgi:hypothetical protein